MGKSLSLDIRERVVALVDEGLSGHEAAWCLRISAASAVRIMQRKKRTGDVKTASQGRPRRSKLDAVSDWLKRQVETQPDITMPELAKAPGAEHGLSRMNLTQDQATAAINVVLDAAEGDFTAEAADFIKAALDMASKHPKLDRTRIAIALARLSQTDDSVAVHLMAIALYRH